MKTEITHKDQEEAKQQHFDKIATPTKTNKKVGLLV